MIITEKNAVKQIEKRNDDLPGGKRWSRLSFLLWLLTVIAIVLCIRAAVMEPVRVKGRSMETTLIEKDYMFVEKLSYTVGKMRRGDVIICYFPKNNEYSCVKRIIGLPGETVDIKDGVVYINGVALEEPYLDYAPRQYLKKGHWEVQPGEVFVLGDNRPVSHDSSSADVGCIPMERVIGRVRCRLFPFNKIRTFPSVDYNV